MQERTKTYCRIYCDGEDDNVGMVVELSPMKASERDTLAKMIRAFGEKCAERRDREAQRREERAAALEAEAKKLRGE